MPRFLVTTTDNPFNPFTQSEEWEQFDRENGYQTNAYLARIAKTSSELSDQEYDEAVNEAVNQIVLLNITGNYRRVTEPDDLETA